MEQKGEETGGKASSAEKFRKGTESEV